MQEKNSSINLNTIKFDHNQDPNLRNDIMHLDKLKAKASTHMLTNRKARRLVSESSYLVNDGKRKSSASSASTSTSTNPSNELSLLKASFSSMHQKKERRTSLNQSATHKRSNIRLIFNHFKSFLLFIKNLQLFKFSVILIMSILINSLYFNFYYLPLMITNTNLKQSSSHQQQQAKVESSKMKQASLPYLTADDDAKLKYQKIEFNSFDHIVFPPMGEDNERHFNDKPYLLDNEKSLTSQLEVKKTDENGKDEAKVFTKSKLNNKRSESQMALKLALSMYSEGKYDKAAKIYKYALSLDPENIDALTSYGEYLEIYKKDVLKAEHFYTRAIKMEPHNDKANLNLKRALPIVNKLDRIMLNELDMLLKKFYEIPSTSAALKRAKKEAYFAHIFHSNAIEGNTLNLQQTRHIVENRMAVNGKSLFEHQEVLGLDAAMRFINETLLYRRNGHLSLNDILDIHKRVLGYCDPIESGKFRNHQVYVGSFTPPPAEHVQELMNEFIEWLNSNELLTEVHPIQAAALAHYKFVYIHPFYDGNGRTARLLMNLILMRSGYPPIIIKKHQRLDYYEYLEMANKGDIKPFIRFIAKCAQITLEEYIRICNNSYGISVDIDSKMIRNDLVDTNEFLYSSIFDDKIVYAGSDGLNLDEYDDYNEKIIIDKTRDNNGDKTADDK